MSKRLPKVKASYKVRVVGLNDAFRDTEIIYSQAVTFLINVVNSEWETLKAVVSNTNSVIQCMERLINPTDAHPVVKYDFTKAFPCFPCYIRRAAIKAAAGCVSSYHSNHDKWVKNGKRTKEPKLQYEHYTLPVFYKGNAYVSVNSLISKIKLYNKGSWKWYIINLRKQDVKYIQKYWSGINESAPSLVKCGKARFLRFFYEKTYVLPNTDVKDQTILAVDLGVINSAVCSVMRSDGTVAARRFINAVAEKDQMGHALNKLKKQQRKFAPKTTPKSKGKNKTRKYNAGRKLWAKINRLNDRISAYTAREIVKMAIEYNVYAVVFEYLDMHQKSKGSKDARLNLWRKKAIQKMVLVHAHANNIHIYHVSASNTSALAFDGSGKVMRDKYTQNGKKLKNHSMCTFQTGKIYNCDLNATYNIGARYFIREIIKPFSVTRRSQLEAKVPGLAKRTQSTLSTLITLNAEIAGIAA